jgi:hypothetical protein
VLAGTEAGQFTVCGSRPTTEVVVTSLRHLHAQFFSERPFLLTAVRREPLLFGRKVRQKAKPSDAICLDLLTVDYCAAPQRSRKSPQSNSAPWSNFSIMRAA